MDVLSPSITMQRGPKPSSISVSNLMRIKWSSRKARQPRRFGGPEENVTPAVAPLCRYRAGRAEMVALRCLGASRFVDVRDPIQVAYARIANRAMSLGMRQFAPSAKTLLRRLPPPLEGHVKHRHQKNADRT